MRKILNLLALGLVITGLILNNCNIMGSSIVLVLAAITMLLSLTLFALKDNKETGLSNWLNYFLAGIVSLLIIGTTIKLQQWGGSHFLLIPAFALLPIALIALIFQKDEAKISKQFFVTSFVFFIFLLGTLPGQPFCMNQCERGDAKTEACCTKEGAKKEGGKQGEKKKCCAKGDAKKEQCKEGGDKKGKCSGKGDAKKDGCKKEGGEKDKSCDKGEGTKEQRQMKMRMKKGHSND